MGGSLASQRVGEFWRNAAASLNSIGDGATKEAHAWKTYWHELKYRTRKRDTVIRQHARGTGGGDAKKPLTVVESRILQILGEVSYAGNLEVQIPLNLPQAILNVPPPPESAHHLPQANVPPPPKSAHHLPQANVPPLSESAHHLPQANVPPLSESAHHLPQANVPPPPESAQHPQNASPPLSPSAASSTDSVAVGPRRGRTAQGRNSRPYRRVRFEWARRYEEQRLRIDRNRERLLERLVTIAEEALVLYRRSLQH